MEIRPFELSDYEDAAHLWRAAEGVTLSGADSREEIGKYLLRNPGLSFVAREEGRLVGAVLCGHDGRRGYVHHLAVAAERRGCGLGRELTERCMQALAAAGIEKAHLFVHTDNESGRKFWDHIGWAVRLDILTMSRKIDRQGD